jgi:hypothetical protein
MTSRNNSSHKIHNHIGDHDTFFTGNIHLSQFKDPNDDLTPNVNLIDNTKELFNQDAEENQEVEPTLNKKLFLASMNNSTRDESISDGPFNSSDLTEQTNPFRTANNNEISTAKISLIPKKRNIPSALKKFQSHTTINQPSTITPLPNKRHTSNKQDKTFIDSHPTELCR